MLGQLGQHRQHQFQVVQGLGQAAARQQPQPLGGGRLAGDQRLAGRHGRIEEGVAEELQRPAQLLAQVAGRECIAAEHPAEAGAGQAGATGPGQAQPSFVMA